MKTIHPALVFLFGFLAALGFVFILCANNMMPMDCCSNDNVVITEPVVVDLNDTQGVVIKKDSADILITRYDSVINELMPPIFRETDGYKGGRISVLALQNLINQVEPTQLDSSFVNIRFGYLSPRVRPNGNMIGDVCMIFSTGSLRPEIQPSSNQYIIRTSGPSGFCPTRCR
jgi:hypothetical protein